MTDSRHAGVLALDPGEVTPAAVSTDDLRAALDADDNQTRVHAAAIAARLASIDTTAVEPLTPTLIARLDDDRVAVLRDSLTALSFVARDDVELVRDAVPGLVDLLAHDVPIVRSFAARPVRTIALDEPDWFTAHVDGLLAVVETPIQDPTAAADGASAAPDPGLAAGTQEGDVAPEFVETQASIAEAEERRQFAARTIAANVLVEVATHDPDAIAQHIGRVIDCLDSDGPAVQAAMVDVVGALAESGHVRPDAVIDPLCRCLDSDDDAIRARALRALGHLQDPAAIPSIRAVAEDDDAPGDLRTLAAETADWLSELD